MYICLRIGIQCGLINADSAMDNIAKTQTNPNQPKNPKPK